MTNHDLCSVFITSFGILNQEVAILEAKLSALSKVGLTEKQRRECEKLMQSDEIAKMRRERQLLCDQVAIGLMER